MTTNEEKSAAVEANQILLLLSIEDISAKTPEEMEALIQTAKYYRNMKENHVLVDDEQVLEKYYDMLFSYQNRPTWKQKLIYNLRRLVPRRGRT